MKKAFLLLMLIGGLNFLKAQTTQSLVPHIPTSPQAEAFKQYGEYAANYSIGTPDISIPLYEIDHRGYKIPVVLKYIAQPLKPGYNYDVVGQGWALSVNGCISRTIEYQPDELKDFVVETPGGDYARLCGNSCLLYKNYAHDRFSAVLPNGTSFEFIIDKQNGTRNFIVSDGRSLKIECNAGTSQINWFTVIDEDGVKYTFDGGDTPYQGPDNIYSQHYVSWQLSRIDLPNSSEPILFTNGYLMQSPYNSTCPEPVVKFGHYYNANYLNEGLPSANTYFANKLWEYPSYSYKMRLLSEISYGPQGKTKLKLLYKNPNGSSYNYVDKIQLLEDNSLIKEVKLCLSFYNLQGQCGTSMAKLDSLSLTGSDSQGPLLKYRFIYSSTPSAFSGTDHWGNRSSAGNSTMPNFILFSEWNMAEGSYAANAGMMPLAKTAADVTPFYKFSLSNYPYSDSRTSEEPSSHSVLKQITYPTGGYTVFEYENHSFFSRSNTDGSYIYDKVNRVIRKGGGFRIKTIENYSEAGVRTGRKNFRYGKTYSQIPDSYNSYYNPNVHTGAGEPLVDPNILTYMNYSSYMLYSQFRFMILGLNSQGQHEPFTNPYNGSFNKYYWDCTFSALNFRRILNGRPAVLYDQVTVYEGDIDEGSNIFPVGKTVYTYDLTGSNFDDDTFEQPQYYGNMLGYIGKSYRYNKLISKTDYLFNSSSGDFRKVRKETNSWNWIPVSSFDYQYTNPYPEGHVPQWEVVASLFSGKSFYIGYGQLQSKSITQYSRAGDSITVSENNSYNGRGQLTQKETLNSDGYNLLKTSYEYPGTPGNGTMPPVIQSMLDRNIISPVMRNSTGTKEMYASQYEELEAMKTDYASFGTNQFLPAKKYKLEIKPTGSEYVLRSEVKSYSSNGNPLETVSDDELHTSYVWGYGDRYLVAEAKNARANEIFVENFEEEASWDGGLTAYDPGFAHSGIVSGRIDKPAAGEQVTHSSKWLSLVLTAPKRFKYSGWVYSNGPSAQLWLFMKRSGETGYYSYIDQIETTVTGHWIYIEKDYEIPADVTQLGLRLDNNGGGSVWFDDLRIHPSDAQITTCTYKPLVGMTSMTDGKGITTYYDYDTLQRLKEVKDADGNIIKSYDYHYKP